MKTLPRFAICLLLGAALAAQTVRLRPGARRRFTLAPQPQASVLTGFSVVAPGGTARLSIEVETDDPAQDVSLWVRFGRDVETHDGLVTKADFTSQTLGPQAGRERIVIDAGTSPPLQTGVYYIAIATTLTNTSIAGEIRATLESGGISGTYIISTFDADTDGWTRNYPAPPLGALPEGDPGSVLDWASLGGNPGGYLRLTDANGLAQDAVVAPAKFLGNLAALVNPRLEFDYRHTSMTGAVFSILVRILAGSSVFQWSSLEPPSTSWTHYRLPLNSATFIRVSGQEPLDQALANVYRIEITMDQAAGGESNGIDNFALIGGLPAPPPAVVPVPAAPVTSAFDSGLDGWGRNFPLAPLAGASVGDPDAALSWLGEGGNPGGWIRYAEPGGPEDDFFVAPPKFLGNIAALPNPRLEFDFRHAADPAGLGPMVVRLVGAGSSFLWIGGSPAQFGAFSRFTVRLEPNFFVRESGSASIEQALANVQRIEISSEMAPGSEQNGLDNVTLISSPTPPLRPVLSAGPASLVFSGTAGAANPASQSLRISSGGDNIPWAATVEPAAPWLTLSAVSGVTPATINVAVNLSGLAPGTYTATIRIAAPAAGNSPQSVAVRLEVAPSPASLPRINAGGVGNAAVFRPPLAPGGLGTLFGLNLGPAEGALASFAPGTQRLPTNLRGVRVLVREPGGALIAEAPLLFARADQINFQMPVEAAGRSSVALVVDNNGLQSAPETVAVAPVAPGLFVQADRAIAQNQDFSLNSPANPAARGSVLIVYLTGQGAVSPPVATGQAAPASPLSVATAGATASIGGVAAPVLFLGLTPGLVGLAQANIAVPEAAPPGEQILLLSVGGQAANAGRVSIR